MPTLEDPSLKGNRTSSSGYGEPPTGSAFSLGDRDYLERQNSLTQPGSPEGLANQEQYGSQSNQFPSGYLGSQTIGSQTTPQSQVVGSGNTGVRSRLLSKTNEKLVNTVKNTKVGQVASKATETYDKAKKTYSDIKSVGKLLATGGTDIGSWLSLAKEHALPLLKKHWPILVALILVAEMPFILIAIAIATSLGSLGNPAGGVAVAANTQYSNARCSEMQSTLVWKMQDGKAETLTFYATEGQFSHEEPYDIELKKGISFNELRNKTDPKAQNYFPDSWKPYYASARMGYAAFNFDATHDKVLDSPNPPFKGMTHESSYVGRRVIFYNPANGKSVVAILADWGPGPSVFKERTDTVKQQQRELWNGPGSADGFRLTNPPNDPISLIGGGPSTIGDQIGADEYTPVEMGFATDQTLDPTKPFKCTPVRSTVSASTVSGQLPADKGICSFCKQMPLPDDSPNINHNYGQPKAIVLHYLATPPKMDAQKAWTFFKGTMEINDDNQKYVQFVVNHDGSITQFFPETKQVAGALFYNKDLGFHFK